MTEFEFMTWEMFDSACRTIARRLQWAKINSIYGVPRGGLVVAVRLSHQMKVKLILNPSEITNHTLIVDDIADTGRTLEDCQANLTATLYYHKQSKVIPTVWVYEKKTKWIVFPWETKLC